MIRRPRTDFLLSLVLLAAFFAIPLVTADDGILYLGMLIMVWSVFALGYDIAFGTAGILSFGHAAFFGMGAYGLTWAQLNWNLPFSAGVVVAGLAGTLVALLVGYIGKRITGLFFSLLTLMMAELVAILMLNQFRDYSGGVDGIPGVSRPSFMSLDFFNNGVFYWVVFGVFFATLMACKVLKSSPLGNALQGIRQNPVRAEQLGFSPLRLRMLAMGISGFISGVAGGLMAALMMYASPQLLGWKISGDVLIMTLLGGSGTLIGPILGVTFFEVLREVLSSYSDYWYGMVGIVFILCTLFLPGGLGGIILKRRAR